MVTIPEPLDPDAAPDRPAEPTAPDEGPEGTPVSEPPDQHSPAPDRSRAEGVADLAADGRPLADSEVYDADGI